MARRHLPQLAPVMPEAPRGCRNIEYDDDNHDDKDDHGNDDDDRPNGSKFA